MCSDFGDYGVSLLGLQRLNRVYYEPDFAFASRSSGEKGRNIDEDIGHLVRKGLPPLVQQALDAVRVIGNEAVHPGTIDLKDDRDTAGRLFDLVNIIAEQMISNPKHVKELYDKLPESKRKANALTNYLRCLPFSCYPFLLPFLSQRYLVVEGLYIAYASESKCNRWRSMATSASPIIERSVAVVMKNKLANPCQPDRPFDLTFQLSWLSACRPGL